MLSWFLSSKIQSKLRLYFNHFNSKYSSIPFKSINVMEDINIDDFQTIIAAVPSFAQELHSTLCHATW